MPEIAVLTKAKGGRVDLLDDTERFRAACMVGDLEAAKALAYEHLGADPDRDRELQREATSNRNLPAVRTMIDPGFEVSPCGTQAPVHVSTFKEHPDIMCARVDAGANTTIRDPGHHSPSIRHAMHNQQDEAITR